MFCAGTTDGMALALVIGVSGFECAAGVGRICTRLGESVAAVGCWWPR